MQNPGQLSAQINKFDIELNETMTASLGEGIGFKQEVFEIWHH